MRIAENRFTNAGPVESTIQNVAHLELWIGNARQAAHYYCRGFGFSLVAYAGPETGVRDRASYVVRQGGCCLVLTAALLPNSCIAEHVHLHGDGIRDVAFSVTDAAKAFRQSVERGAVPIAEPWEETDVHGTLRKASIASYGGLIHTFVEHHDYKGCFAPHFVAAVPADDPLPPVGLFAIDHVVGNVESGQLEPWARYYEESLGFARRQHFDDETISTPLTALTNTVLSTTDEQVKLLLNEPGRGTKRSQIEEYLLFNGGPGVQHVAFATRDIQTSVRALRARGIDFLHVPAAYREAPRPPLADNSLDLEGLQELGILVDRDVHGHLLQIFTCMPQDRPTLFFELIERRGSNGFGAGNVRALFAAFEREQAQRGNL
ncbi:4-hydroxyphenylpyruvate dioxygenase [Vitiosangium sp. GDMCC 1.1324]|uniref:4-hydroxyphenylpyruvate dioxygenase n=1 Tax=Vitiosangium sp. (strain GDMCC 1.1324) TaxID=2138576 RepID=UPI0018EE6761|nr:4-hydroxyphenylpyruvate dioxygenase [Vitiosangium sp. GDMCC 1.1324]